MWTLKELKIKLSEKVIEGRQIDEVREKVWDEVHALQKDIWKLENGLDIGDTVDVLDGKEWRRGKITGIGINHSLARPIIKKLKKDGSVSQINIYIGYMPEIRKVTV